MYRRTSPKSSTKPVVRGRENLEGNKLPQAEAVELPPIGFGVMSIYAQQPGVPTPKQKENVGREVHVRIVDGKVEGRPTKLTSPLKSMESHENDNWRSPSSRASLQLSLIHI
eukprot:TRINITY_DN20382_c0_g1_i1.p1 TRINITY_DN20382_c0_g1~~TRINITY_DN20382_c0_g1_i1.p1  ORF type:complete len:112 (+),score=23.69 TRINITY_DN20382_c0_g1_i1:96-431(+)